MLDRTAIETALLPHLSWLTVVRLLLGGSLVWLFLSSFRGAAPSSDVAFLATFLTLLFHHWAVTFDMISTATALAKLS